MSKVLKNRPSPALLISVLALFVALGSGAYAVKLKLGKNAVKTKNIKKSAVTTKKIADAAVSAPKLADGAVTTLKLANASVDASKLAGNVRGAVQIGTAGQNLGSVGGVVRTSKVNTGVYCVDLSFTPIAGVASVNPTGGGQGAKDAQVAVPADPATGCPAGFEAEVDITTNHAYSAGDARVYVVFM
jgi:hypothetical protein